jgi:hypothetical protein
MGAPPFLRFLLQALLQAGVVGTVYAAALGAALLVPVGLVVRMLARARLRAGHADPLEGARAWSLAHPRTVQGLTGALALAWSYLANEGSVRFSLWLAPDQAARILAAHGIAGVLSATLIYALARLGTRAVLAPTLDPAQKTAATVTSDEIRFDAVAVTRETIAAVVAMAALQFWPLLLLVTKHHPSDAVVWSGMLAQALLAFAGAAHFRYKSKIAVGVDGVYVTGSGRTRFFAYRDLDGAKVTGGGDLLLTRGKRTALRLQLHGEDALKRDAVLARIGESIARAKDGRAAVAVQLVSTASPERLANAASGGGDYRGATLTREQLWALVEGPEVEESARRAAAEALARTGDHSERARLRVAAEHCAAPQVRVALLELADAPLADDRPARTLAT